MRSTPNTGAIAEFLARHLCRVSVRGEDNLPAAGPAIVVCNHTTIVDVIVTMATLRRHGLWVDPPCQPACEPGHRHVRVMATADLLGFPVLREMFAASRAIPVDAERGAAALVAARRALAEGEVVVIYPEGDVSASDDGSPRPWRPGTAALVAATGAPVHPLAHHDSRHLGHGSVPVTIARALTGIVRLPRIRVYAGPAWVPPRGSRAKEIAAPVEAALAAAWAVARDGRLG